MALKDVLAASGPLAINGYIPSRNESRCSVHSMEYTPEVSDASLVNEVVPVRQPLVATFCGGYGAS